MAGYTYIMEKFKRARTKEQIANRQGEIITVCDSIYRKKGYEAVHFNAVSKMTSVSRSSIYNYYNTKEEIFLDLLMRDFGKWTEELKSFFDKNKKITKKEFCIFLSDSLLKHEKYFELLAVYMPPIEKNSRLEKLTAYRQHTRTFFNVFIEGLGKFFPKASDEKKRMFYTYFQTVVYGLYPLTHLSDKQLQAMKKTYPKNKGPDFRQICINALMLLIADIKKKKKTVTPP
jgi:AcrR family transcriptional regulator